MSKKVSVAILGSTGFVGLELTKILSKHPNVNLVFLGTENNPKVWHKDLLMIMSESIKDAQLERCDVDNYMDNVLRDKGLIK